jgi:glutaredoxin 3
LAKVEIYTRPGCGYCTSAKALLRERGVDFIEYDAGKRPEYRADMIQRSGGYTFPQVIINGKPVGGSDDIHELDARNQLTPLLAGEAPA